jgi:hypothetical protein
LNKRKSGVKCEPTVRGELVSFKNRDAEHVLLQVLDEELTIGVPLRIQRVLRTKENNKVQTTTTTLQSNWVVV